MADSQDRSGAAVPPEGTLVVVRGIGASLFLTDRQLILARDGAERRPRTGVP